ncbi:MAG: YbjQ family protein [bacterium]
MIISTANSITNYRIVKTIGLVRGNSVRGTHIGKDILAVIKNVLGGEIEEYTKLLAESRDQSVDRMVQDAEAQGANAIIEMRFSTSQIMANAAEILAYGTAVIIEPLEAAEKKQ